MKVCSKCGKDLPLSEFYKNKARKDGLQGHWRDVPEESWEPGVHPLESPVTIGTKP